MFYVILVLEHCPPCKELLMQLKSFPENKRPLFIDKEIDSEAMKVIAINYDAWRNIAPISAPIIFEISGDVSMENVFKQSASEFISGMITNIFKFKLIDNNEFKRILHI